VSESLLCGVGAKFAPRVVVIAVVVAPLAVHTFEERYFDGEAKEAMAFALLALLHLESRAGNVPTATGARGYRVLGALTPGAA
jgi:anhydro-N-acetylmuramic acid kinase